ncbi:MAG: hypothetical protein KA314_19845 [Chloroflexi bacterium]|nr:hypothetical protein [Chloroflexota bacterium]MBP8058089.1 hypothetical protein [Chloroflexota bacterium]
MRTALLFTFLLLMVLWPTGGEPCPPVNTSLATQVYFVPCDGTIIHLIVVSPASFSSTFSFSVLLPILASFWPAWIRATAFPPCQRTPNATFARVLLPPPRTLTYA